MVEPKKAATRTVAKKKPAAPLCGKDRHADPGRRAQARRDGEHTESLRKLRRARNRAFWTLATLSRRVCRRGQYAFRKDSEKRSIYTLYRRSTGGATEEIVDPNGGGGNK